MKKSQSYQSRKAKTNVRASSHSKGLFGTWSGVAWSASTPMGYSFIGTDGQLKVFDGSVAQSVGSPVLEKNLSMIYVDPLLLTLIGPAWTKRLARKSLVTLLTQCITNITKHRSISSGER